MSKVRRLNPLRINKSCRVVKSDGTIEERGEKSKVGDTVKKRDKERIDY